MFNILHFRFSGLKLEFSISIWQTKYSTIPNNKSERIKKEEEKENASKAANRPEWAD